MDDKHTIICHKYYLTESFYNSVKPLQQPNREYTIEEIAKKTGFSSRNRFFNGYRAIYSLTPTGFLNLSEKNPHQKI